uniref:Mitochondrial chaperone BCS1 n=1 Tax=Spongospora subterranea TaxID=70186 RepID=A0A0H5QUD3_9EUKA|eukprot:CRZ05332.1 hypothetical protein [Spongospora subterranea]
MNESSPTAMFGKLFSTDNVFFSGGFGLAVLGAVAQLTRKASSLAGMMARRHFLMTLEVTSKDASYPWVLNWISNQGRNTQHLTVSTVHDRLCDGSAIHRFTKIPGPGRHVFWQDNRLIWVERERQHGTFSIESGVPWEKVVLTCIGRDTTVFDKLLHQARDAALDEQKGNTVIYSSWGSEWKQFGHPRQKRSLDSVILEDGVGERIVADLDEWRKSAKWYHEQGIPYRRGYLVHGPPGGGKTSFIYALAGYLNYNICILSVSDRDMTDDRLAIAMSNLPQQSILLLEDIDAAFVQRSTGADSRSQVTFSGLLNTLDGIASSEERIVFMTTNFIERLDPALMRPGRVDLSQYIRHSSKSQAQRLFMKFYQGMPNIEELSQSFVDKMPDSALLSMASLQGYLMRYKASPTNAVDNFAQHIANQVSAPMLTPPQVSPETSENRPRRRRLTAFDVDRVVFNPQSGSGFCKD